MRVSLLIACVFAQLLTMSWPRPAVATTRDLRVLYVEGVYRYGHCAEIERSIRSHYRVRHVDKLLVQRTEYPNRWFRILGDVGLPRDLYDFPQEALEDYDLLIMYDVPAAAFKEDDKIAFEQFFARGGDLILIGGHRALGALKRIACLGKYHEFSDTEMRKVFPVQYLPVTITGEESWEDYRAHKKITFHSHPIVSGIPFAPETYTEDLNTVAAAPGAPVIAEAEGQPFILVNEKGACRAVVVAGGGASAYFRPLGMQEQSFLYNGFLDDVVRGCIDWACGSPDFFIQELEAPFRLAAGDLFVARFKLRNTSPATRRLRVIFEAGREVDQRNTVLEPGAEEEVHFSFVTTPCRKEVIAWNVQVMEGGDTCQKRTGLTRTCPPVYAELETGQVRSAFLQKLFPGDPLVRYNGRYVYTSGDQIAHRITVKGTPEKGRSPTHLVVALKDGTGKVLTTKTHRGAAPDAVFEDVLSLPHYRNGIYWLECSLYSDQNLLDLERARIVIVNRPTPADEKHCYYLGAMYDPLEDTETYRRHLDQVKANGNNLIFVNSYLRDHTPSSFRMLQYAQEKGLRILNLEYLAARNDSPHHRHFQHPEWYVTNAQGQKQKSVRVAYGYFDEMVDTAIRENVANRADFYHHNPLYLGVGLTFETGNPVRDWSETSRKLFREKHGQELPDTWRHPLGILAMNFWREAYYRIHEKIRGFRDQYAPGMKVTSVPGCLTLTYRSHKNIDFDRLATYLDILSVELMSYPSWYADQFFAPGRDAFAYEAAFSACDFGRGRTRPMANYSIYDKHVPYLLDPNFGREQMHTALAHGMKGMVAQHMYTFGWEDVHLTDALKRGAEAAWKIRRFGPLMVHAAKMQSEIAVLHPFHTSLILAPDFKGKDPRGGFIALLRGFGECDVIHASHIRLEVLSGYKTLYIFNGQFLPQELTATILEWVAAGGTLCIDNDTGRYDIRSNEVWAFRKALKGAKEVEDRVFEATVGKGKVHLIESHIGEAYEDAMNQYPKSQDEILRIERMLAGMARSSGARPHAWTDTRNVEAHLFDAQGAYVMIVADHRFASGDTPPSPKETKAYARVPRGMHAFDLVTGDPLTTEEADGATAVTLTLEPADAAAVIFYPRAQWHLSVVATAKDDALTYTVRGPKDGLHLADIRVFDPQGRVCAEHGGRRVISGGRYQKTIPLAVNDPDGEWQISAFCPIMKKTDAARVQCVRGVK